MVNNTGQFKNEIAEVFTLISVDYDTVGTPFFSHFGQKLVDFAGIRKGSKVLDIACGKGASLIPASQKVGSSGSVIGIDLSKGMIKEISSTINRMGLKNAEAFQADAESLNFPDAFFDVILCGFGIDFFLNPELTLREIKRVLVDNGTIALATLNDEHLLTWRRDLFHKYIRQSAKNKQGENNPKVQQSKQKSGAVKRMKMSLLKWLYYLFSRKKTNPHFGTVEEMGKVLSFTGFVNIRIYKENLDCYYKNEEEWFESLWSTGVRRPLEKISPGNIEKFKKEAFEYLQHYKKEDGIVITKSALISIASKGK